MSRMAVDSAPDRLTSVPAMFTGRLALAVLVATAVMVAAATGTALGWSTLIVALAALSLATATFVARSLVRAVYCMLASVALLAGVVAIALIAGDGVAESLRLEWAWIAYLWWALPPLIAGVSYWREERRPVHITEYAAGAVALAATLVFHRKIDTGADLLPYLVRFEDNQAWVSLVTAMTGSSTVGPGFQGLGPIVPSLLGLLVEWQGASAPRNNAVVSAFALAVIVLPVIAVGLLRRASARSGLVIIAFALVLVLWALRVPQYLYTDFGHLSASWAYLLVLAFVGSVACDRRVGRQALPATLLAYAFGAVWFPLIPLAVIAILALAVMGVRERGLRAVAWMLALQIGAVLVLAHQLLVDTLGVRGAGAVSGARETLVGLYAAQGGTASLDAVVQIAVLAGIVGMAFIPSLVAGDRSMLWIGSVVGVAYAGAVFAGSLLTRVEGGYGATKVWFVVGSAVAILLLAAAADLRMPARAVLALLVALLVASVFYGGTAQWLTRDWVGTPDSPPWLAGVTAVANLDAESGDHPIACYSGDTMQAYLCTRWAAGLTPAGDTPFIGYRLAVVSQGDPSAELDRLAVDGTLGRAWVVMLDEPPADHPWAWRLISGASRVFAADGQPLEPRPEPTAP